MSQAPAPTSLATAGAVVLAAAAAGADTDCKAFATLQARAALAGWVLAIDSAAVGGRP